MKLKYLFTALFICLGALFSSPAKAQRQTTIGSWTPFLSYEYAKDLIRDGDMFYVNTRGGYYHWNTQSNEFRTYSPIDGLSDVDASAMHLDTTSGLIFMGYDDGTVNYFQKPFGSVRYLTDIQRSNLFTSKRINKFLSKDGMLYIATDFGVVIFDIEKEETRSSVTKVGENPTGQAVVDMEIIGDSIYLCLPGGLYRTSLNQPNITVPNVWEKLDGKNLLPAGAADQIAHIGRTIYVMVADSSFTLFPNAVNWFRGPMPHRNFDYFETSQDDSLLYVGYDNYIRVQPYDTTQYLIVTEHGSVAAHLDSEYTIYSDPVRTLRMVMEPDTFVEISPDGPHTNTITQIAVGNGEILVAPQGQAGATSGPSFVATGFYYYNQDSGWTNYLVEDQISRDSIYRDIARLHYNPETRKAWFGSWGQGIVEFQEGEILRNYMSANSGLPASFTTSGSDEVRISGLEQDPAGNLWACSILADEELSVLTPEGEWYNFSLPGTLPVDILVDDWDSKWIINNGQGIVVFSDNGTLDNPSDDQIFRLTTASGNGGLPSGNINAITKDLNGHIWIGTLEGIAVYANPSRILTGTLPDASCPVIDGFCLLRDQRVTAIEVDGANRKWIGTENGVYVVNPQGNRLIEHLTVDNSPLLSDEIRDIEIDPVTGEIFFATTKGLISLMGEAIEGKATSEDLYVYPNPIYDDYDGQVAITCSVRDAEVRIANANGMVVRELTALGGQAVWDGRDAAGNRLAPGVYLAMVADSDGKSAGIAKFAVVARNR